MLAFIALAAVAFVVMGAVVIADMLVRRDLAKKVVRTVGNDPVLPLVYKIRSELKPDLEKSAPAIDALLKGAFVPRTTAQSLEDVVWKKFHEVRSQDGGPTRMSETVELESR